MAENNGVHDYLRVIAGGKQDLKEEDGSPIVITVLRQPVLSRERDAKGNLKRGYVRTKEPLEKRQERLLHMCSGRATVTWGHGTGMATGMVEFAVKSGRMVGSPDWILDRSALRRLRKMARDMFPSEEPSDDTEDEPEERSPMEIGADAHESALAQVSAVRDP